VKRLVGWLFYTPLHKGCVATNCCLPKPPPAYAFFPCQAGCGGGCAPHGPTAGGQTIHFTKPAGFIGTTPVVQAVQAAPAAVAAHTSGYGNPSAPASPSSPASPPEPAQPRLSTYNPRAVASQMPVLAPEPFRKPPPKESCPAKPAGQK
jgi:hypothetical protein